MVQLYLIRVIRALYDKPPVFIPSGIHSNSKIVTNAVCNAFIMHCEWDKERSNTEFKNECEICYDNKRPGPLATLLKLCSSIIDTPPKCLNKVVKDHSSPKPFNDKFHLKILPSPSSPDREMTIPDVAVPRRNSVAVETLRDLDEFHEPVILETEKKTLPKPKVKLVPKYSSIHIDSPHYTNKTFSCIPNKYEEPIQNKKIDTKQEDNPLLPLKLDFSVFRGKSASFTHTDPSKLSVNCEQLHIQPLVTEELAEYARRDHQENLLLIGKTLLTLIYKLDVTHPDYKKIIELIAEMSRKNDDVFILTLKKLLNSTPKLIPQQCYLFRLLCTILSQQETTKTIQQNRLEVLLLLYIV